MKESTIVPSTAFGITIIVSVLRNTQQQFIFHWNEESSQPEKVDIFWASVVLCRHFEGRHPLADSCLSHTDLPTCKLRQRATFMDYWIWGGCGIGCCAATWSFISVFIFENISQPFLTMDLPDLHPFALVRDVCLCTTEKYEKWILLPWMLFLVPMLTFEDKRPEAKLSKIPLLQFP